MSEELKPQVWTPDTVRKALDMPNDDFGDVPFKPLPHHAERHP